MMSTYHLFAETNYNTIKYNRFDLFLSDIDFIGISGPSFGGAKTDKTERITKKNQKKSIENKKAIIKKSSDQTSSEEQQLHTAGQNLFNAMQYAEAEDMFIELLQKYPDTKFKASATYHLAVIKSKTGKTEEAAMYYNKIIHDLEKSKFTDQAYYDLSSIYTGQKDHKNALKHITLMQQKYPKSPLIGDSYVLKGTIYENLKNYGQAISSYQTVIDLYPKSMSMDKVYFQMGSIYEKIPQVRNLELAAKYFQKVLDEFPESLYTPDATKELDYLKENFLDYR